VSLLKFIANVIATELDLNKMAAQFHIPKKYTWEEPLLLQGKTLESIFHHPVDDRQSIFIFAFGSIVFINITPGDELVFNQYLKSLKPDLDLKSFRRYLDDYELRESGGFTGNESAKFHLSDQFATLSRIEAYHPELVSTILAKSAALECIEEQMGKIFDTLEGMIDRLEKGKLRIGDKALARTTAKIIRHEYNTIAYIMILDKPDITWTNSEAAEFYDEMAKFFELNDRYLILKQKTDVLNIIIGHFSSISHSLRGLLVEWIILLLILVELVVMIIQLIE
jgi:uncharacterized Rmd1/YagE family protein